MTIFYAVPHGIFLKHLRFLALIDSFKAILAALNSSFLVIDFSVLLTCLGTRDLSFHLGITLGIRFLLTILLDDN